MAAESEHLKNLLKSLPDQPGVYQHLDKDGKILYIGKAKNLKRRVSSYFNKNHDNARTYLLVKKIRDVRTIITHTEFDALLLENNLIKEHQPKYNVNLKDDKTYPWICIKRERFPRIFSTRNPIKDGSDYYGPYPNVRVMRTVLDLIRHMYHIRTCNLNLNEENIESEKHKVCLEYHIKFCKGPCEGLQSEEDYMKEVESAREIIRGNISSIVKLLNAQMHEHSERMEFESAHEIKQKLDLLKSYQAKSTVVSPTITNVDVFSIISDEEYAYVNYLMVIEGAIIQGQTVEIKKKLNESDEDLLALSIPEFRHRFNSTSKHLYLSHEIDLEIPDVQIHIPKKGDKRQLIDMSQRNAKYYRVERLKNIQIVDPDRHTKRIMAQMKADLRMTVEPRHIECFDNSNIQGTHPVAACVVFKNGKPSKADYRKFNIKTVEGPDDFASMEEIIFRRYSRIQEEGGTLPDLIVIDGGKGQLGAALKSLEILGLRGKIAIIGIAKRLEEIYFPGDPLPLYLDKRSESLKIIQQARNEAHRFGITFHRQKRSKAVKSKLEEIPGIGSSTISTLLKKYKSANNVSKATQEDLELLVGKQRARKIWLYFHPNE